MRWILKRKFRNLLKKLKMNKNNKIRKIVIIMNINIRKNKKMPKKRQYKRRK